jgi:hypothetical protein
LNRAQIVSELLEVLRAYAGCQGGEGAIFYFERLMSVFVLLHNRSPGNFS